MTQHNAAGQATRDALLALLEVHTEGATTAELGAYIDRVPRATREQLDRLADQGLAVSTPADRNTKLWHLAPREAEIRAATPTPLSQLLPALQRPPRPALMKGPSL